MQLCTNKATTNKQTNKPATSSCVLTCLLARFVVCFVNAYTRTNKRDAAMQLQSCNIVPTLLCTPPCVRMCARTLVYHVKDSAKQSMNFACQVNKCMPCFLHCDKLSFSRLPANRNDRFREPAMWQACSCSTFIASHAQYSPGAFQQTCKPHLLQRNCGHARMHKHSLGILSH